MTKTITPSTIADLHPATILALAKMLPEKVVNDARDQLEAGDHPVEATLHLRGEIEIEEDESALQPNRLDPLILFQVAMEKLNTVSMEAVVKEACARLRKKNEARIAKQKALEAESPGKKVKLPKVEDEPEVKEFKERVSEAYDRLAHKTMQRRRGAVTVDVEISATDA
jgi:hypothetical protein